MLRSFLSRHRAPHRPAAAEPLSEPASETAWRLRSERMQAEARAALRVPLNRPATSAHEWGLDVSWD